MRRREGAFVERAARHRLVHRLQITQGALPGEEMESRRRVAQLAAQPLDRHARYLGVVEGQGQGLAGGVQHPHLSAGLALPWHLQPARGESGGAGGSPGRSRPP
jgi:hypothetical protein